RNVVGTTLYGYRAAFKGGGPVPDGGVLFSREAGRPTRGPAAETPRPDRADGGGDRSTRPPLGTRLLPGPPRGLWSRAARAGGRVEDAVRPPWTVRSLPRCPRSGPPGEPSGRGGRRPGRWRRGCRSFPSSLRACS